MMNEKRKIQDCERKLHDKWYAVCDRHKLPICVKVRD